jgi:hypothetical protein
LAYIGDEIAGCAPVQLQHGGEQHMFSFENADNIERLFLIAVTLGTITLFGAIAYSLVFL